MSIALPVIFQMIFCMLLRLRLFPVGGAVAGLAGQTHATTPTASTAALAPGAH